MGGVPTLAAIDEHEALGGRQHGRPIGGIHPRGAVSMAGGESGALGELSERPIVVADRYVEPCRRLLRRMLHGPSPHGVGLDARRAWDEDRVALPGIVGPAREQDAGDGPCSVDPEELVDLVRPPRPPPPPLHIRGLPHTGAGIDPASALQQLCRQRERLKPRRSDLSRRHVHLLLEGRAGSLRGAADQALQGREQRVLDTCPFGGGSRPSADPPAVRP